MIESIREDPGLLFVYVIVFIIAIPVLVYCLFLGVADWVWWRTHR